MKHTAVEPCTDKKDDWEHIPCPVCSSTSFTLLFEKEDEPFVRCNDCSLVLINPRRKTGLAKITYNYNYSETYAKKGLKKLRRCRRWVRRVQKRFLIKGRWLDVGCSVGYVVLAAKESGYDAYGIDVENWGVEYGRKQFNLENLQTGILEDQKYPDNYFSVISLYDVIEHVPNLNSLGAELKRILAPNGVIDIITPDINHWRVPKDLAAWKETKPSEHLYYFNRGTLSRLLDKYGLQIIKKRFHIKPALRVYVQHV